MAKAVLLLLVSLLLACTYAIDPFVTTLVKISYASYCGTRVDAGFNCYWCKQINPKLTWVGNFGVSGSELFGFVGYFSNLSQIVVFYLNKISFRGTDNVKGWITDGKFLQDAFPACSGCYVHHGFWQAYNSSVDQIRVVWLKALALCPSCATTYVTGHSLGAGLATLAATDLQLYNISHSFIPVVFGSPRVGNAAFAQYVNGIFGPIQRYTHVHDPVPLVPPMVLGYHHPATEIWQDSKGVYHTCDSSGEDPNCIDSTGLPNPIDHATYVGVNVLTGVIFGCMWFDP